MCTCLDLNGTSFVLWINRELKQPRRRRKRKRHLKMSLRVSAIIFQLFKVIMFEKCVLTILELNWNQRLGHKKRKWNICHHMLTSSKQLQNRSFHVVERTRTSSKCQKLKNARAKRAKILSNMQICRVLLPSSSWLLKLTETKIFWWNSSRNPYLERILHRKLIFSSEI